MIVFEEYIEPFAQALAQVLTFLRNMLSIEENRTDETVKRDGMNRAFTLIELLVVIAIVSVLAGSLLPVFAQVRKHARMTGCLSHARQLAIAIQTYTQDFDESLPPQQTTQSLPKSQNASGRA